MSDVDDAMQMCALKVCESEKYRVMLKRNNSIVKDTMSKLWKLNSIIQNHINQQTGGTTLFLSEPINEEGKDQLDEDQLAEEEPPIELQDVVKMIPDVSLNTKGIKDIKDSLEFQEKSDEQECEFVKRMIQKAYADKKFEDPKIITQLAIGKRKINRHAATLVIQTINKLLTNIITIVNQSLNTTVLSDISIKKIYSTCSRFYVAD